MATTEQLERALPSGPHAPARIERAAGIATPLVRRRGRGWTLAIALVAMVPFAVGAYAIIERGFPPGALFGDRAILALNAIDAFRAPVLLGPYSRFYWHHPGPLYFYLLNGWSAVFGQQTVGLVLGATAINVASAVGILVLARRRGGRPLLLWASILLTAYLVAIDPIPFDIWNPSVTLLAFVVVLLLAWSITCGDWWAAPWCAFVASFVVQTHIGLAPAVAMAFGVVVIVCVWRHRHRPEALGPDERRTIRRVLLASGAILFLAWLPRVIEEVTGANGNLSALVRLFTRPGSPHSLVDGIKHTGLQATLLLRSVVEPVSIRSDAQQGLVVAVVVSAIAFVVAVAVARKARAGDALVLLLLVAAELVVGVYAVTKIVGPIQFYLVQWISAIGLVLWLAIGYTALQYFQTRAHDPLAPAHRGHECSWSCCWWCWWSARSAPSLAMQGSSTRISTCPTTGRCSGTSRRSSSSRPPSTATRSCSATTA